MGGKGSSGGSPDVVYVVLERSIAMDLLNALYIALGIMPRDGGEGQGDGGTLEGKGGGVKKELGGSKSGGSKPKGVKTGGSRGVGKSR